MERAGVRASARQVCDPPRSCPSFLTGALGRVHDIVSLCHLAGYYNPSGNAGEARPRFIYPSFRHCNVDSACWDFAGMREMYDTSHHQSPVITGVVTLCSVICSFRSLLAGPIGFECKGRLEQMRRLSASLGPNFSSLCACVFDGFCSGPVVLNLHLHCSRQSPLGCVDPDMELLAGRKSCDWGHFPRRRNSER
jgi:hypothetical protein